MQCPARSRAASSAKLDEIYQRFPRLAERRRQMGTTLSGGEQQMLAIARVRAGALRRLLIERGRVVAQGDYSNDAGRAALLSRISV